MASNDDGNLPELISDDDYDEEDDDRGSVDDDESEDDGKIDEGNVPLPRGGVQASQIIKMMHTALVSLQPAMQGIDAVELKRLIDLPDSAIYEAMNKLSEKYPAFVASVMEIARRLASEANTLKAAQPRKSAPQPEGGEQARQEAAQEVAQELEQRREARRVLREKRRLRLLKLQEQAEKEAQKKADVPAASPEEKPAPCRVAYCRSLDCKRGKAIMSNEEHVELQCTASPPCVIPYHKRCKKQLRLVENARGAVYCPTPGCEGFVVESRTFDNGAVQRHRHKEALESVRDRQQDAQRPEEGEPAETRGGRARRAINLPESQNAPRGEAPACRPPSSGSAVRETGPRRPLPASNEGAEAANKDAPGAGSEGRSSAKRGPSPTAAAAEASSTRVAAAQEANHETRSGPDDSKTDPDEECDFEIIHLPDGREKAKKQPQLQPTQLMKKAKKKKKLEQRRLGKELLARMIAPGISRDEEPAKPQPRATPKAVPKATPNVEANTGFWEITDPMLKLQVCSRKGGPPKPKPASEASPETKPDKSGELARSAPVASTSATPPAEVPASSVPRSSRPKPAPAPAMLPNSEFPVAAGPALRPDAPVFVPRFVSKPAPTPALLPTPYPAAADLSFRSPRPAPPNTPPFADQSGPYYPELDYTNFAYPAHFYANPVYVSIPVQPGLGVAFLDYGGQSLLDPRAGYSDQ